MAKQRVGFAGLVPVAFQSISLSNSTAVAVNSTVRTALPEMLHISVETQDVRYRADGTDPTLNTGVVLKAALTPVWFPYDKTSQLSFQRSTGSATVSIMAYKYN